MYLIPICKILCFVKKVRCERSKRGFIYLLKECLFVKEFNYILLKDKGKIWSLISFSQVVTEKSPTCPSYLWPCHHSCTGQSDMLKLHMARCRSHLETSEKLCGKLLYWLLIQIIKCLYVTRLWADIYATWYRCTNHCKRWI